MIRGVMIERYPRTFHFVPGASFFMAPRQFAPLLRPIMLSDMKMGTERQMEKMM